MIPSSFHLELNPCLPAVPGRRQKSRERLIRDHCGINHVNLKDFHAASDWDPENPNWTKSHFEALGRGNISFGAGAVLKGLEQTGYDGWISVELGPQRPAMAKGICPSEYMRQSREYLRSLGY